MSLRYLENKSYLNNCQKKKKLWNFWKGHGLHAKENKDTNVHNMERYSFFESGYANLLKPCSRIYAFQRPEYIKQ